MGTSLSAENKPPAETQATLPFSEPSGSPKSRKVLIYIDGGSRGNPGDAGAGAYFELDHQAWRGLYQYLGRQTNNYAEYAALLLALQYALQQGFPTVAIRADSQLLVRQMTGIYRVKDPVLQRLHSEAKRLLGRFERFSIQHIPRERNRKADALANKALDLRASGEDFYS